ncbi:MAG: threonine ammonia-lyase [Bacteroidales bacterium]|jgi:threonine dehydratase
MNNIIKFSEIVAAKQRLKSVTKITDLMTSKSFSQMANANVFLKLENLQSTGSFKVRGAYNKLASLTDEEKQKGVVAASAGNHAQGVAFSATRLGVKSTIFMPIFTPPLKVLATRGYGANVILTGETFDDAYEASQKYCKEHNATYIHPFDDKMIIAGQGTIGIEIYDQLPEVDIVLVPIGGGGLISGVALAMKELNPNIKIIGVEAEGAASMYASRKSKEIVNLPKISTIADGIAVKKPGKLTYSIIEDLVDDLVVVNDTEIAHAAYLLLQRAKLLAEPSGVAPMAAVLFKKCDFVNKNVVTIISGGNINMQILEQIIEKGMYEEGLKTCIQLIIPDQPGELKKILSVLDSLKANIADIEHDRSNADVTVGNTMLTIKLHLQSQEQLKVIINQFKELGLKCKVIN